MANPTLRVIPDILEEHFEELQFLWGQRRGILRSPQLTMRELVDLDERIEAHAEGLMVAGEQLLPFVQEHLVGDDSGAVFAAAYSLLRLGLENGVQKVLAVFQKAEGPALAGLKEALCHAATPSVVASLGRLIGSAPPAVAVSAAEVLAFQRKLDLKPADGDRFLKHEKAAVRQGAWRSAIGSVVLPASAYQTGFRDDDAAVRREALLAAAWNKQPALLDHCRGARQLDPLYLLAVLGKPSELPRIETAGKAMELGPNRLKVLGAFGHPGVVEWILKALAGPDPRAAVAAGLAFTKITGVDVASDKRVQLPPEDGSTPDEFEKEFLDEAHLPDADRASAEWLKTKDRFAKGTRWCRGFDLSQGATSEVLARLDLESRWEACLRGGFEGTWKGQPHDLDVLPQKG